MSTRLVVLLVSFALAFTALVTGAVGAHAATSPSSLNLDFWCERFDESPGPDQTIVTVTGNVGETFTVIKGTGAGCNNTQTITGASGIVTPNSGTLTRNTSVTFTLVASGTFTLTGGGGTGVMTIIVAATAPGGGGGGAVSSPPDIFQSIALTGAGTCASLNRTDLDWAAAETGNWTQSWEQWPNAGKGGPVCRRVLWYSSTTTHWHSIAH